MKISKAELNEKTWYRIVQVIFGLFIAASTTLLLLITWEYKPKQVINQSLSYFTCNSDGSNKKHQIKNWNLYLFQEGILSSTDENEIKRFCYQLSQNPNLVNIKDLPESFYKVTSGFDPEKYGAVRVPNFIPTEKNYNLKIVYDTEGSWTKYMSYNLIGVLSIAILFLVLRSLFLYIATGKFI